MNLNTFWEKSHLHYQISILWTNVNQMIKNGYLHSIGVCHTFAISIYKHSCHRFLVVRTQRCILKYNVKENKYKMICLPFVYVAWNKFGATVFFRFYFNRFLVGNILIVRNNYVYVLIFNNFSGISALTAVTFVEGMPI